METVTRKRLGKAVLLSLLLMNVCKEGAVLQSIMLQLQAMKQIMTVLKRSILSAAK